MSEWWPYICQKKGRLYVGITTDLDHRLKQYGKPEPGYKEISARDSDRAIQWLQAQVAMARPKIRRKAPDKWKQSLHEPIYARVGELVISKDGLYLLAQGRLAIKKPIQSPKELTQRNLQRLHHVMIYEVKKSGSKPRNLVVRLALIKEVSAWTCGSSLTSRIGSTFSAIR
jgi:predicted GIY-YIG superfamily endonuclease